MRINFMRKVDYYLGISLCFAFSLFGYVKDFFFPPPDRVENPKNILFIKLFGLGSIVLSLPAIRRCRELYPDAQIHYLTFSGNRQILDLTGMVPDENIVTVRSGSLFNVVFGGLCALWTLRRRKIDVVVDFEFFSRLTALFSFLTGARCRIGFFNPNTEGLYRGHLLTHGVYYSYSQHTSQGYLDMVETMRLGRQFPQNKIQHRELPWLAEWKIQVEFSPDEVEELQKKFDLTGGEDLYLINPNCSDLSYLRQWPQENFVSLAQKILEENPNAVVAVAGGPGEEDYSLQVMDGIGSRRTRNLAGRTTLRELLLCLSQARAFITNDSGPAHMAALTPVPILTLFGPETAKLFSPLSKRGKSLSLELGCSPCLTVFNGKYSPCLDNQCLIQITTDRVWDELETLLED